MIEAVSWGALSDGREVHLITMTSSAGAVAEISTFGGVIRAITIPTGAGQARSVVLGLDSPQQYEADTQSLGITVAPYANRIKGGSFTLDGKRYDLVKNEGDNTLHSSPVGNAGKKLWDYTLLENAVQLSCLCPDGEAGFPGNTTVTLTLSWDEPATLALHYTISTDKITCVSPTNHSYFHLGGEGDSFDHKLYMSADRYTPVDGEKIPTGELLPVSGTPFDFTTLRTIGQPYDHNLVLTGGDGPGATLISPDGVLAMDVYTDLPGIQLYTGHMLKNQPFPPKSGICLETQFFPDSPNHAHFPSTVLTPEAPLTSTTRYAFRVLTD